MFQSDILFLLFCLSLALLMASTQVVKTSVSITDSIPFLYYSHPNVQTSLSTSLSYGKVTNLPYAK